MTSTTPTPDKKPTSIKKWLQVALLILTIGAFAYYFFTNRSEFNRLLDISPWQVALILLGQVTIFFANVLIMTILVQLLGKRIPFVNSARVTAYSSLVNFFGFLQGGVGLRGIYLKTRYGIPYKKYALATVAQYIVLFSLSGTLILAGILLTQGTEKFALLLLAGLIAISCLFILIKYGPLERLRIVRDRVSRLLSTAQVRLLLLLTLAVALQLAGSFVAYTVELAAIGASFSLGSVLIFAGVSQFSIVIALTPGAIGIREGLLLLVQQQMLISTSDIVIASTLDRLVYFVTLLLVTPLALNARRQS